MDPTISREQLTAETGGGRARVANTTWSSRTRLEKVLLAVSSVAVVACVALVAVVATTSGTNSSVISPVLPDDRLAVENRAGFKTQNVHFAESLVNKEHLEILPVDKVAINPVDLVPEPKKSTRLPVYTVETSNGVKAEICNTPECTIAAADIINALDTSVDPCEDFYKFACGGWIKSHPIPDTESRWTEFDVLDDELNRALTTILTEPVNGADPPSFNKAKTMYAACMDNVQVEAVGVTPLLAYLDQFGGWPMALENWASPTFNWESTVALSRQQTGADYLIYVWVFADEKNTFSTAIYIDQTSLAQPRSVLMDPASYQERLDAYKVYMTTTAKILAQAAGQVVNAATLEQDASDILAFEEALAAITTPSEDRRDIERMYNPMTVADLQAITAGSISWQNILSTVFAATGISIDSTTRVIVQEIEYLKNLATLVTATPSRVIANYLLWRHVRALGDDTNQAMRDASFQYSVVASGVTAPKPRRQQCADKTNRYLGYAVGTKYVVDYFSQQAKDETNAMVEDIRSSFKDLLGVNTWMDEGTKPKAVEKADAISKFIAYPDWYGNDTALETFYTGLGDLTLVNNFNNVLGARNWQSNDELDDFGLPTDREQWFSPPTIVNAYYLPEFNSITFPAGILQPPFYRANSLQALNYGGIGQVIGHEITHGFDDQGRQNDKDGNAIPWWSNATLIAFQEKAQCIIDQYSSYRVPEIDQYLPNATLNGVNTQGENIADNGGLREALLAYGKYVNRTGEEPRLPGLVDYTPEQLFFLSNANIWCGGITTEGLLNQVLTDPHSPSKARVVGPMSNMQEFSRAWSCPAGSPMNPAKKCVVW